MSRLGWNADVYIDKLGLNPYEAEHHVVCPFHPDSNPSLSINLTKAAHFCFGGCAEPKGGGPVQFLVKWARYQEHREITPQQARAEIKRMRRIPDAATLRAEITEKEMRLFAEHALRRTNTIIAICERLPEEALALFHEGELSKDDVWDVLATAYRRRTWAECAYAVCLDEQSGIVVWDAARRESVRVPAPAADVAAIYTELRRLGWWDTVMDQHTTAKLREYRQRERALDQQLERERSTLSCPDSAAPVPRPPIPRTPLPIRSPVPIPTPTPSAP